MQSLNFFELMKRIEQAVLELNQDGIVAIPTETVYGLAGNAFSEKAVRKIFTLKKRPFNNPLIVHIKSVNDLTNVAQEIPDLAYNLATTFWPGPLTLILKKKNSVAQAVTAGLETVAVRMPNHPLALDLLERLDFPLAAPSANPFGSISPTTAAHVFSYFGANLKNILDGGECERGVESTIIGFDDNNHPTLYRYGSISLEEIERVTGQIKIYNNEGVKPNAPGMLSKHYAPVTESILTEDVPGMMRIFPGKRIGLLLFKEKVTDDILVHQEILSETGDFEEAAKNLYSAMHRLDEKGPDVIIFQQLPMKGLGLTINDKLRRAAKK